MTRRILWSIVAVAGLAVAAFGIPLGIAVRQVEHDDVISTLQREVARTAAELPSDLHSGEQVRVPRSIDGDDVSFVVYDASGRRIIGRGPAKPDKVVKAALTGRLAHYTDSTSLSVGWPLTANEKTYGAVRASLPESGVETRVRTAWALMALLAAGVVGAAALLAWRQARRLAGPVDDLAGAVTRLGQQDFTTTVAPSGVPELDRAGEALGVTASRLGRLLERERSFSADASHQLRTPLTGLRLVLESAASGQDDPRPSLEVALAEVDRLEATVDDLLRLARQDRPVVEPADLGPALADAAERWGARAETEHRRLAVDVVADLPVAHLSPAALRQIVDVLLANAFQHGAGTVTLTAAPTPGGLAVEVRDEGPGAGPDVEAVFARGAGSGHGIGLALARSLAEAEGARLTLEAPGPRPCFRLLVPADPA